MTTQVIPDPMGLKTWEEAFQYPLPTVRKLSVRLRQDIDDHRNRLRSLVGTSYRDLLGTAERIIEMDTQVQGIETDLGDIGRLCNSRLLDRAARNFKTLEWTRSKHGGGEGQLGEAARSAVLASALAVVERLVKRGGDALHAAKLMVLSRLLYKSLEDDGQTELSRQRKRITALRTRLLTYIDRLLCKSALRPEEATNVLSAFALLSSSKLRDALDHFLAVRLAQLESFAASPTSSLLLESLKLYADTLQAVRSIFPKRLADSLSALGRVPLLDDEHIKSVDELGLDVHGRWIPEEVRGFRPWVQNDTFPGEAAREDLAKFSTSSLQVIKEILESCLELMRSASDTVELRKQVLSTYLSLGSQVKLDDFSATVEELRSCFTRHLNSLAEQAAATPQFVFGQADSDSRQSVWSLAEESFDLSAGGVRFRRALLDLRHGQDQSFINVVLPLRQWSEQIRTFSETLNSMRSMRWDDEMDVDGEDGDEALGKDLQDHLIVNDPTIVAIHLRDKVDEALGEMLASLQKKVDHAKPSMLLRVLREYQKQERAARATVRSTQSANILPLATLLHSELADATCKESVEHLRHKLMQKQYIAVDLWEGTPSLPTQPLPAVFKFFMDLQRSMAAQNEDVWSTAAVYALKKHVESKLSSVLLERAVDSNGSVEQHEETEEDKDEIEMEQSKGDTEDNQDKAPEQSRGEAEAAQYTASVTVEAVPKDNTTAVQRLFDSLYCAHILTTSSGDAPLSSTVQQLKDRVALNANDLQRLEKSAGEYWRRSYLLFGSLAPVSSPMLGKR